MMEITAEIRALIDKAAAGVELAGDEYIDPADGLIHCKKCGGQRQTVLEGERAVKVVVLLDEQHAATSLDYQIDDTPFPLRHSRHRLQGIVDHVAEQAVQITVFQKSQLFSIHHTGELDAVLFAVEALFGKQHIQQLVVRLDAGIVDGDGLFQVVHLSLIHI